MTTTIIIKASKIPNIWGKGNYVPKLNHLQTSKIAQQATMKPSYIKNTGVAEHRIVKS